MLDPIAYLPGYPPHKLEPLARYLPPVPDGVASKWLSHHVPIQPDDSDHPWLLDPFCASPRTIIEAAHAGYRVLVAANNPVARFLLELLADPPTEDEFHAALAELAAARKGDERLELHISSLYMTNCDDCGKPIIADAFLWERDTNKPFARTYHCPHCSKKGEYPTIEEDISRAAQFAGTRLHHARALERVASLDDPDRHHVEEALEVYLPRALYALFSIINRLDGMNLSQIHRKCLQALCLTACDQANTLWQYPTVRARPKQLNVPSRFREINIWLALEQAIDQWTSASMPVPIVRWPQMPSPDGGISVFEGRLKDLVDSMQSIQIDALLAVFPRPNQAFWTLSAVWAGWLWGKEAVKPFKSALRRRRYDWSWHTIALGAALQSLKGVVSPATPMLGMIGEVEPGFLSSALVAAEGAGFQLLNLGSRVSSGQAQIMWRYSNQPHRSGVISDSERIEHISQASQDYLKERGEPTGYLKVHAVGLSALVENHLLDFGNTEQADPLNPANVALEGALLNPNLFTRFGGSEKTLEVGQWWLTDVRDAFHPLSDRVERILVQYLIDYPHTTTLEIDTYLCAAFPGLQTPESELIHVCLDSYGEQVPPDSGKWIIRPSDHPRARRADIDEIRSLLSKLGKQLGYAAEGDQPLLWLDPQGELKYAFYIIASAIIGDILCSPVQYPERSLVVMPGGRANLVVHKLHRDPRLREALESGWRFMKYRLVRMIAETPVVTRDMLDDLISQDELTYDVPQLRLF